MQHPQRGLAGLRGVTHAGQQLRERQLTLGTFGRAARQAHRHLHMAQGAQAVALGFVGRAEQALHFRGVMALPLGAQQAHGFLHGPRVADLGGGEQLTGAAQLFVFAGGRSGGFSAHGGAHTKLRLLELEGAFSRDGLF